MNTILGNIKNALRGTYHAVPRCSRYLSEFAGSIVVDLPDIIPRHVRTPPINGLKLRWVVIISHCK